MIQKILKDTVADQFPSALIIFLGYFKSMQIETAVLSFFKDFYIHIMEKCIKQCTDVVTLLKTTTADMFKENHQQVGQLATELLTMKEYIGTFYELVLKCQRNQGIGVNFLAEQEPFVEVLFQMCGIISLHEDQPPVVMISMSGVEAIDNPHNEIKSQCFNILTVLL